VIPVRVLGFTNLLPTPVQPTRGVFNLQRWEPLARRCDLRALVPVPWHDRLRDSRWRDAPAEADLRGIPVRYAPYFMTPRFGRSLYGMEMFLSLLPAMRRLRREFPFEALLAAWAYPDAVAAALFARLWRVPLVAMVLGSDLNALPNRGLRRAQVRWALRRSSAVVAVSEGLGQKARELGVSANQLRVQHNCVDGKLFQPGDRRAARERLGLPLERPVLLFVGNLKPVKGVDVLVEAVSRLPEALRSRLLVAIVGSGDLEAGLRSRAAELGLEEQVRFVGRRPHAEVPTWLTAADALCLPSRMEGCPNVILEALASGRPVIASRVGGIPELMDDSCGALAQPESPADLARAIHTVLARDWDPNRLRARVEHLSWEPFGDLLYDALCRGRAATAMAPSLSP